MQGGGGARSNLDGLHACDTTMGFLRNTPIESIEADIPIVMRRYHLVPDSAGAGRYRGGMGVRMDFQVFHPDAIVTARGMERFKLQPWGVAGGVCGSTGHTIVNPGSPQERSVGKIDYLRLNPGDTVSIQSPAGGGYGDPLDRDPEAVAADVRAELVSAGSARDQCGVVLNDDAVDIEATATLRRQLRREHGPGLSFDY